MANIPWRADAVEPLVAESARAAEDRRTAAVGIRKRFGELIARLNQQAIRQATAEFQLQSVEARVNPVRHHESTARGLRVGDEEIRCFLSIWQCDKRYQI